MEFHFGRSVLGYRQQLSCGQPLPRSDDGRRSSIACGSFIAFRAWLVTAFLLVGAAVLTAVVHLVWPSRWWNGLVTTFTGLSSFALFLTLCLFASIIHSSAASPAIAFSTSLDLSIAAFISLLFSCVLWTLSEYRRTHRIPPLHSASPTSISLSVPPVRLTEESDRRRDPTHSAYSLDEDEGALLEVRTPTAETQVKVEEGQATGEAKTGDGKRREGEEAAVSVGKKKRKKERRLNTERETEEEEVEDHELAEMMSTAPVIEVGEEGEGSSHSSEVVRMDEEVVFAPRSTVLAVGRK